MDTLPETDATSTAAYFGIIPAPVRYCKALPPAAKLLFSEITALTKREGYCWASNAHFQELYGVDRATIKRWLAALIKEGFIRVDLVPGTGIRRIYDLTIPPAQKRTPPGAKVPRVRRESAPPPAQKRTPEWYNESEREKEKESDAGAGASTKFVGPGPVPARALETKSYRIKNDAASPELPEMSEQETPSASTVKSNSENGPSASRLRNVQRVVALTKDVGRKADFERLWDELHAAGKTVAWASAVDEVKHRAEMMPGTALAAPERLSAMFLDIARDIALML